MLPIISSDQRKAEVKTAKIALLGKPGIGKTSQLKTLPADSTLFVDLEAGDLSVKDWDGDTIRPTSWLSFKNLVLFLAGKNLPSQTGGFFCKENYDLLCQKPQFSDPSQLDKYQYYFIDSLTALSRICFSWAKTQPQSFSEKTGKPNLLGTYGLLADEMIAAINTLQIYVRDKHIVFVAVLTEKEFEGSLKYHADLHGAKTYEGLHQIIDQIVVYTLVPSPENDKELQRVFINYHDDPWGYRLGKDRSTMLDMVEEPNLFNLIQKCTRRNDVERTNVQA